MTRIVGLLVILSACSAELANPPPPPPDTVRELLEAPARLLVVAGESGGAITAERKVGTGWEAGMVELGIENGELIVSSDARDAMTLDGLQISFQPIEIGSGVFGGHHAQLTDVHMNLTNELRGPAVWTGDNEVHMTAMLTIAMTWTLTLDGSPAPLGAPTLPAVPVEIVLTGNGAQVDAELRAHAPGELWGWAGLIKLSELQLVLGAQLTAE